MMTWDEVDRTIFAALAIGFAVIIILLTLLIVVQIGVLMRPRRRPGKRRKEGRRFG